MRRLIYPALVILMVLSLSLVPFAAAEDTGSDPSNAIDLAGTMSGTLGRGAYTWYRFYTAADSLPKGLTMNYTPATAANIPLVGFTVGLFQNGQYGAEFVEIGQATPLNSVTNNSWGIKYWRAASNVEHTYYVQVKNSSQGTVDYAIALTGAAYPPPFLTISSDGKQPSYGEWPAPDPLPTPEATGGGATPESAVALTDGQASGTLGPQSRTWLTFTPRGDGRSTGLTLKFNPVTETNLDQVTFKIWTYKSSPSGAVLIEIGKGTRSGNPFGPKYWRGGSDNKRAHYIEVINDSGDTLGWEMTLNDFWPYWR